MPPEGANAGLTDQLSGTRFTEVRWVEEVDSTNRALAEEARSGVEGPVVLVADHQTAGRGRRDRTWLAPPSAGLLVSVLVTPAVDRSVLPLVTVAAGVATLEAVEELTDLVPDLKWPNDVIVEDRKLAGVLAEGLDRSVVVGVGTNVDWPEELPDEIADTAVALNHLGQRVDRAELLVIYLRRLHHWLGVLEAGHSDQLVDELRRRCVTLGQDVVAHTESGDIHGTARDVDDRGELLVDTGAGVEVISAADVIHVR